MANVFIEALPKGAGAITSYAVEDAAGRILYMATSEGEAIGWAKGNRHDAYVARDRHLADRENPDHWLKV